MCCRIEVGKLLCDLGRTSPTAWRCQICNLLQPKRFAEAASSARCLQDRQLGLLVKQCRRQPGFGPRQAQWRHGFAAVQNPCICHQVTESDIQKDEHSKAIAQMHFGLHISRRCCSVKRINRHPPRNVQRPFTQRVVRGESLVCVPRNTTTPWFAGMQGG